MKLSLRAMVFRYMLAVIAITAVIRLGLWLWYQAYESSRGHVVFHEQINEFLLLLLVEVLALTILCFMLWRISRLLLSPLRSVANAANLISKGRLEKRIRTCHLPKGELFEIAEALNASFDRYQDAIERISRFSGAASHQLRTPLTAMRTTAELSLAKGNQHDEALFSILEEIKHLSKLTEQLLLLSRMEIEHVREQFFPIELNKVVLDVVELFRPVMDEKELTVSVDLAESCVLSGDDLLIKEAIVNLVDNAVKCSRPQGELSISTAKQRGLASFQISDSGCGIKSEIREHLFDRFSRDPATTYKGSGLGLSIVSEVIKLHDGHIEAENGRERGATFKLFFPTAN